MQQIMIRSNEYIYINIDSDIENMYLHAIIYAVILENVSIDKLCSNK